MAAIAKPTQALVGSLARRLLTCAVSPGGGLRVKGQRRDAYGLQALRKLDLDAAHWTVKVRGVGNGYWRAVGTAEELMQKSEEIGQQWLCGVGLARLIQR